MKTAMKNEMRTAMVENITNLLTANGEEVLRVKSNEIALPFVAEDGEEGYYVITVKIPSGSRDGEDYDGYAEAESYEMKEKEKAEKIAKKKADAEKKKAEKAKKNKEGA